MKLLSLTLFLLSLSVAAYTSDPISDAWACRCDTCCQHLDKYYEEAGR